MTAADLIVLLPLMVMAAATLGVLLVVVCGRHHAVAAAVALVGLAVAVAMLPLVASVSPHRLSPLLIVDAYGLFYMGLLLVASFVVTLLAYGYLEGRQGNREEFYILLLLATLGAAVLVVSGHFAAFFLGLEILSVSLYALIAYLRAEARSLEAGIKYLLLAAASSAFLLLGMALIYAELGTMEFARLVSVFADRDDMRSGLVLTGLALIITGVGFKLAVVPFHMWTPDVYEGAPAPVTAFIATVSKGAMVALLLRYFMQLQTPNAHAFVLVFSLIAIASMFVGNLLALLQDNVKRVLAYSSIAHLGYMLVALVTGGAVAVEAVTYYLVAYMVTTLCAFGIVTVLSEKQRDADALAAYRGLFWRHPWLAIVFAAALFSLAGIPFTAGFLGKFYVLAAGVEAALWLLVVLVVLNSALGLFYYLRIVVAMYAPLSEDEAVRPPVPAPSLTWAGSVALGALTFLLVWLGVYPTPFMSMIRTTVLAGLF